MLCPDTPNQSLIPKAFQQFDDNGRMLPSSFYNRVVDVMEELAKFTYLTHGRVDHLVDRYGEGVETAAEQSKRVNETSSD